MVEKGILLNRSKIFVLRFPSLKISVNVWRKISVVKKERFNHCRRRIGVCEILWWNNPVGHVLYRLERVPVGTEATKWILVYTVSDDWQRADIFLPSDDWQRADILLPPSKTPAIGSAGHTCGGFYYTSNSALRVQRVHDKEASRRGLDIDCRVVKKT